MKKGDRKYFLVLASTFLLLFLIIFSSPGSVSIVQGASSKMQYAYVPNEKTNDVSVINTTTNTVISTLPVGNSPDGVVVNNDGTRVYVTNFGNDDNPGNSISIIYTDSDNVISMLVGDGKGLKPFGIAILKMKHYTLQTI